MNRRLRACGCLWLLPLCGCGTLMNMRTAESSRAGRADQSQPARTVYGGVKLDAAAGRRSFDAAGERPLQALVGAYVWGVDLPVSAVGDTLTLPLTVPAAIGRGINEYYFPTAQAHSNKTPSGEPSVLPAAERTGDLNAVHASAASK